MMARLMSLFSPGVTWQIGEARLARVDSEYPPPRFVYWPTSNGPSALLSEPEAREVLAAIILSGDSQRAALLAAIAAHADPPEAMFDISADALLEQCTRACPELVAQVAIEESLDGAVAIIIEALAAGHRIEWAYREMMFDWSIDPDTNELLFTQDNGERSFTRRVSPDAVPAYIRQALAPGSRGLKDLDEAPVPGLTTHERIYISQAVRLLGAGTLRAWMLGERT